ncbi:MAG: hypothetical protein ACO330_07550, partial [Aquiluna sp.]
MLSTKNRKIPAKPPELIASRISPVPYLLEPPSKLLKLIICRPSNWAKSAFSERLLKILNRLRADRSSTASGSTTAAAATETAATASTTSTTSTGAAKAALRSYLIRLLYNFLSVIKRCI